ncbi:MAG: serine hydrolase [Gammaproteobacteria bacterium]|nr:MAG: serine hydrolase [Gammaproteobacteria bacterium]
MFSQLKPKDLITVVVLVGLVCVGGYYYANPLERAKLWLKTYPLRASLSTQNLTCSADAPTWMAEVLKMQVSDRNAPSNQIAYIDKAGALYHCENGYVEKYPIISDAVTPKTRFRYASVTKMWTADSILRLIKQGKLNWDTRLAEVLPVIQQPQDARINEITIKQLLLHQAGFDRTSVFGQNMFTSSRVCPHHLTELNQMTLDFTPGEKNSYSNLGYCLLGEVIAKIEKKPYQQLMRERYQFGKDNLKFIGNQKMPDEVFYNYVETGLTGYGDVYTAFDYPSLASTAGLSGDAITLVKQAKMLMQQPQPNILSDVDDTNCDKSQLSGCYGYAVMLYQPRKEGLQVYFRDGALLGLSAFVVMTEDGRVVALLSNGQPENGVTDLNQTKKTIYEALSGL